MDQIEQDLADLEALERELKRREAEDNPVLWAETRLGDTLWSVQKQILLALRDHRRVAVMSCHEIGKSYISSVATGWWIDVHPPGSAFVVTSAPSSPQVRTILWREIGRVHTRGQLAGRVNQTEWIIPIDGKEEQVAIGRKPNDYDPTAFQGIHARWLMFIFDEACGMPPPLWEAADSLIANERGRALAFGNPDDPLSEFAQVCKPGSGWHVIQVSAFDTPNFTGEWLPKSISEQLIGRTYVEERRRKWAPEWYWVDEQGQPTDWRNGRRVVPPDGKSHDDTGMVWQSKVLGLFPVISEEGGLIPMHWVRRAQSKTIDLPEGRKVLGVDVGAGGDSSCGCLNFGGHVRILWEDKNPDTMATTGKVVQHLQETGAEVAQVDTIGIGKGVCDRGKELKLPFEPVNVGEKALNEKQFVNLRSELWWHVRTLFESGMLDIDPKDEELAGELMSIRYKRLSNGKIQIESKLDAKKRGQPSPNRADALMLSCAPEKPKITRAIWGKRRGRGRAA
jgi:hypothetical protein